MTAEHAAAAGGEVCEPRCHGYGVGCACNPKPRWVSLFGIDPDYLTDAVTDETITRATAADTVLTAARRLCCGDNPAPHHAATDAHSQRMAFAEELARAVRGS